MSDYPSLYRNPQGVYFISCFEDKQEPLRFVCVAHDMSDFYYAPNKAALVEKYWDYIDDNHIIQTQNVDALFVLEVVDQQNNKAYFITSMGHVYEHFDNHTYYELLNNGICHNPNNPKATTIRRIEISWFMALGELEDTNVQYIPTIVDYYD